jgi:hypothetical protein
MKKFSTAELLAVLLMSVLPIQSAWSANACELAASAPEVHHVQPGDTLWGIASLFLNNPWCWPNVWKPNQNLISNPHRIYPGQMIVLNRLNGTLNLGFSHQTEEGSYHLAPSVRSTQISGPHLPMLSAKLQSMLTRTPLISADALASAPTISQIENDRVIAGKGDTIFVQGALGSNELFDVFRSDYPLADPDTRLALGVAGLNIGRARLIDRGALSHRFKVTRSDRELRAGDKLVPVGDTTLTTMFPHPGKITDGKLVAILHEGRWARMHDMVVVNRGSLHGLDPGSVVNIVRHVKISPNEKSSSNQPIPVKQTIGTLLVYKVQEKIALAMIMQARDAISVGDAIIPPETEAP